MPAVVCLLRAVNVGGHNKIGMEALRALFESLKLHHVQTYVQSGNVVLQTGEESLDPLARRIEDRIEGEFGFRPAVVLRTAEEMADAIARNPFAGRREIDPSRLVITFLAAEPTAEAREKVLRIETDPEELHIHGREIFTYYPNGVSNAKLIFYTMMAEVGRFQWLTVLKTA